MGPLLRSLLVLASAMALGFSLAACGGGGSASTQPATSEPAATTAQPPATETAAGGATTGDAAAGKEVFTEAGCGSCHTLADAGSTGDVGPDLDNVKPPFGRVVRCVTNGIEPMPSFKDSLTEQQILDVAAYVAETTGGSKRTEAGSELQFCKNLS